MSDQSMGWSNSFITAIFTNCNLHHNHCNPRIFEEMKPAYSITYGKGPPVIRRGKLYPVKLSLVQKMGNKKVTLVDNLECYGIPATDLAQSLQKLAAASTTREHDNKPLSLRIIYNLSVSLQRLHLI